MARRRISGGERKASFSKSPFIRVRNEVNQAPQLRQRLIAGLEKRLNGRVVTFFTSFGREGGSILDEDAEMLESILAVESQGLPLFLVLNSAGGDALAAERIVNTCRAYSGEKFEVVVPHMAKSAATMICFGANVIHMSRTAELGPVDPQIPYADDKGKFRTISAEEYVRSYEENRDVAASGKYPRLEPFLQQLQRYDARLVEQLKSARNLSQNISIRLLQASMMAGRTESEIKKAIDVFLSQEKKSSHGRMISYSEAEECGLKLKLIDLGSELWNTLWELYVRSNWVVSNQRSKLMESRDSSVAAG
jgi:ClpP class serine protease